MNIFNTEVEQRKENDYRLLLIPRNVVNDWQFVYVVKTEHFL